MNAADSQFYSHLVLRTPAYSVTDYTRSLSDVIREDYFQSALYVASKSLYSVLSKKGFDHTLLTEKERLSVRMYLNRACFRPTPFGLFSGFAMTSWTPRQTEIIVRNRRFHVSFSFDCSQRIVGCDLLSKL